MPHQIKSAEATALLTEVFALAEDDYRDGADKPAVNLAAYLLTLDDKESAAIDPIDIATERLFDSETQAYREALVGCAVARILNPQIDIRYPATEFEGNSFSGRSLADNAVTPFLVAHAIPVSKSPYLSTLRGGARFIKGGEPRIQRDQPGFDALVTIVDHLRTLDPEKVRGYLRYLLRRFIMLRESGNIALKRFARPNLEQLGNFVGALLTVRSGGRIPAMLTTAMFQTLTECLNLGWQVEFQGINVADKASGAVGDITIRKNGVIILGIEVTERPIRRGQVEDTFAQKISPIGLHDYLFVTTAMPDPEALSVARNYTGVGHEMNFVPIHPWIVHNLASIGPDCRALFQTKLATLFEAQNADLKVAWNTQLNAAIGIGA